MPGGMLVAHGRVWDLYLTERDRAHVAMFPARPRGLGTRPALLMVDVYQGVFGPTARPLLEAVAESPSSCGQEAWDALPGLVTLLDTARSAGVPVVHLTGNAALPRWSDTSGRAWDPDARRGHYQIMPQVAPVSGESVIAKSGPSGFWGTPLAGVLVRLGVDSLVVAGESTSGCVRATVVDARSHGYRVAVVEDCVFDRHEASHALSLFDIDRKYGDVISLAAALDHLRAAVTGDESPVPAGAAPPRPTI